MSNKEMDMKTWMKFIFYTHRIFAEEVVGRADVFSAEIPLM